MTKKRNRKVNGEFLSFTSQFCTRNLRDEIFLRLCICCHALYDLVMFLWCKVTRFDMKLFCIVTNGRWHHVTSQSHALLQNDSIPLHIHVRNKEMNRLIANTSPRNIEIGSCMSRKGRRHYVALRMIAPTYGCRLLSLDTTNFHLIHDPLEPTRKYLSRTFHYRYFEIVSFSFFYYHSPCPVITDNKFEVNTLCSFASFSYYVPLSVIAKHQ